MYLQEAKLILENKLSDKYIQNNLDKVVSKLNIDWNKVKFNRDALYKGIKVEREHGSEMGINTNVTGDDLLKTAKIALAHLYELPDYYDRLKKMENK